MSSIDYMGLDVHKKTVAYCVKANGLATFDARRRCGSKG